MTIFTDARNVVNQLGDLWGVDVERRQATNDQADAFVMELLFSVQEYSEEGWKLVDWLCEAAKARDVFDCLEKVTRDEPH